jgi:hypothetical protein
VLHPAHFDNRGKWFYALQDLQERLDEAIAPTLPGGAFVKLSVRSPKDTVFVLSSTRRMIEQKMAELAASDMLVSRLVFSREEAIALFIAKGEHY